jgi:hypothetical protein
MDAFKTTVIIIIIISLGALGTIFYITQDAISNAKIPDVQTGFVISKASISDKLPANYTINLSDNRALYISNNVSLYDSILENQTYVFNCRIDYTNKITIIENATLIPKPTHTP